MFVTLVIGIYDNGDSRMGYMSSEEHVLAVTRDRKSATAWIKRHGNKAGTDMFRYRRMKLIGGAK